MNRFVHLAAAMLFAILWISGCSHLSQTLDESFGNGESPAGEYLEKADKLIQKDAFQLAENYLEIARQLAPEDEKIPLKITMAKDEAFKKADHHFKKGVAAFNRHELSVAKKEFLAVLRYFPEHKAALDYLKNRIRPGNHITYHIQKGNTPQTIAKKVYRNPELAFMVDYFLPAEGPGAEPEPTVVSLPILEKKWIRSVPKKRKSDLAVKPESAKRKDHLKVDGKVDPKQKLAEQLLKKGDYKQVIILTEEIVAKNPDDREIKKLYNYACYYEGKALIQKKQLIPAMEMLNRVTMDLTDIDQLRSDLKTKMKNQSEFHYRRGVTFFINEDLQQAIIEWEKTLALTPENKKAGKAIENAKHLLQKLKGVK